MNTPLPVDILCASNRLAGISSCNLAHYAAELRFCPCFYSPFESWCAVGRCDSNSTEGDTRGQRERISDRVIERREIVFMYAPLKYMPHVSLVLYTVRGAADYAILSVRA